jgi:AcrR family transcriptional regulator
MADSAGPEPQARGGGASGRKELKKSALTRQRILDAAAAVFARNGYGRAMMSEIAQAAGVHITALYYHFSTKDDVAEGVLNHVARANFEDLSARVAALPPEVGFAERLRTAIDAQLEGIVARRDYVLAQSKILSELPEERQERHRALLRDSSNYWRALIHEGVAAGALRGDLDPSITRMLLQGAMNWIIEWRRPGGRSIGEIADQLAETMLHGIAPR